MPRKLSNWLQGYREYTEGTESPPVFHLWIALGTLAGAAQRKIYMETGYFRIHSNMFIILVSPPGRSRKSTALRIGKNLLKDITAYGMKIHFSTQASSVAALVKQLASIENKDHQSLTAFSSELGSLLGSKSVEMTDFLVDIWDCEPDWDKQTVGRGLEKIERPWFNMLAATTPQWMGDNLSKTAVEGGFVARSMFIFDDTRLLVAFPELTEEQKKIRRYLVHDLAEISKMQGQFVFTPEAKEYFREWYESQHVSHDVDYRLMSFYERKHIHLLKVAMTLSLAEAKDEEHQFLLEQRDIETALAIIEEVEPGMQRAFSSVGKNIYSSDLERIKGQILLSNGGMSYRQLLASNIHAIDKENLDKLVSSLVDMGVVDYDRATKTLSAKDV